MAEEKKASGQAQKRKLPKGRHRSAIKRQRQNLKHAAHNEAVLSRLKSAIKKVRSSVQQKNKELAKEALQRAASLLGKAAGARIVHHKFASRHVSRLSSLVQSLTT